MNWNFEVEMVKEVPLLRTSTALPMPWAAMVENYEKAKGKETPSVKVPLAFWTDGRKKPEADCTSENIKGWLKAAFTGFRAGEEKRRGSLLPCMLAIAETKDAKGNLTGHALYMIESDLDAREAAIERAKANLGKAKGKKPAKKGPKKAAAKPKARASRNTAATTESTAGSPAE